MSIFLDRWSIRSSWLVELGERYRVQMNLKFVIYEFFIIVFEDPEEYLIDIVENGTDP